MSAVCVLVRVTVAWKEVDTLLNSNRVFLDFIHEFRLQIQGAQFDCATEISVENSVVNSVEFLGFLLLHFYNSVEFLGFYNSVAFSVAQSNCAPALPVYVPPT